MTRKSKTETEGYDNGVTVPRVVKSRRERFLEQAERRTNQALKRLLQVERLGNRSSYEASDEEYTKILNAIRLQVEQIAKSFAGNRVAVHGFRL